MKITPFLGAVVAGLMATSVSSAAYTVVSTTTTTVGGLTKTDTVVQGGTNAINRFTIHRVSGSSTAKGPLMLLPSANSNFKEYEITDTGSYADTFAGYFASRGWDVWGLSERTTGIAPGACEGTPLAPPAVDCTPMKDWGLATYVADVKYMLDTINPIHVKKPIVGGLSLGTVLATAAINKYPNAFRGALLWDAALYVTDATVRAQNVTLCANGNASMTTGPWYDPRFGQGSRQTWAAGPQATVAFFSTPNPAAVGVPTFTIHRGNVATATFDYADWNRLSHMIFDGNYYETIPVFRDINCSLAGDRTFTNNLAAFDGPVYVIESEWGFGRHVDEQVAIMGSTDVTTAYFAGFGHGDQHVSLNHVTYVEQPFYNWLSTKF